MDGEIYILPQDIRHKDHIHCMAGVKKFCQRTGVDFESLVGGKITADTLRCLDTAMGNEVARNAEERVLLERAAMPAPETGTMPKEVCEASE